MALSTQRHAARNTARPAGVGVRRAAHTVLSMRTAGASADTPHQAAAAAAAPAPDELVPRQPHHSQQLAAPPTPPSRRGAVAAAAVACAVSCLLAHPQQPAWAKPALLDLPACSSFKQAGKLHYCEVQPGAGDSPLEGDLIVVDYTARATATGQVFDGSRNFKFTVGNGEVIPGWEAGILGTPDLPPIRAGGTRTVLIPPELAYGPAGDGCLFGLPDSCRIPPNSPVVITFRYQGLGY